MKILEYERRVVHGWTQMQLGMRVRVHPSMISAMEAGRLIPSPYAPSSRRLAKLLGRPFDELLKEYEEPVAPAEPSPLKVTVG